MTANQIKNSTSIPQMSDEEIKEVSEYSEKNERIRQALAQGTWEHSSDKDFRNTVATIAHNFINAVINLTRSKSDNYDGGSWEFNEHGLISLVTSQEKFNCNACFSTHEITAEELSYAMSVMAANHLTWVDGVPDEHKSFFAYIYHFGYCLLDNVSDEDKFNTSAIYSIWD